MQYRVYTNSPRFKSKIHRGDIGPDRRYRVQQRNWAGAWEDITPRLPRAELDAWLADKGLFLRSHMYTQRYIDVTSEKPPVIGGQTPFTLLDFILNARP